MAPLQSAPDGSPPGPVWGFICAPPPPPPSSRASAPARSALLDAPRQYALGQTHKHLKEMKQMTGLASEPVFCPVVSDFYSGMQVTVPLFTQWLKPGA